MQQPTKSRIRRTAVACQRRTWRGGVLPIRQIEMLDAGNRAGPEAIEENDPVARLFVIKSYCFALELTEQLGMLS